MTKSLTALFLALATLSACTTTSAPEVSIYNSKPVIARITKIENLFSSYNQIDVFVAGQLIETLTV